MINYISFPELNISLKINRVAFSLFGIDIYWYGIIIGLGMALAFIYGYREFKRCGLSLDDLLNMFLIALPVSIVCARLYYVVFSFDEYKDNLIEILNLRNGGIAVYGSLIGAATVVIVYSKKKKLNLPLILDILAVGFLIGQAVGRWGNFINGEAFGSHTTLPVAMTIKKGGVTYADSVHPTFLYESLWDAVGVIILILCKSRKKFDGEVFLLYLMWYGMGRFWIEGLRADSLYIGSVRVSQLVAILSVIVSAVLIGINRRKQKKILRN